MIIAHIAAFAGDTAGRRQTACGYLEALLELYDRGMREPLPLYCATSAAYAEAARSGGDPVAAGRSAWESSWNFDREDKEPEHLLVLGGVQSFEQLLAMPLGRRPDRKMSPPPTRAVSAISLAGSGTACSHARTWSTGEHPHGGAQLRRLRAAAPQA